MKKARLLFILSVLCLLVSGVFAQNSKIVKTDLSQAEIDRIVKSFTSNEAAFRNALTSYVFSRSASISTVGMGGQISGTYRRDSQMIIAEGGKRIEKIVFAPIPTLKEITISAADLDNLSGEIHESEILGRPEPRNSGFRAFFNRRRFTRLDRFSPRRARFRSQILY
jgi:hypothetical protein